MKKTFKSILCLLFAMIFVFQFIGTAAFADGNDEEEEPVDISAAIFVGEDEYSGAVSLAKLKEGVRVVPSEKAYVASVSINGEPVTGYCIADGRVLEIDEDSVFDLIDNEKIDPDDELFAIEAVAEELPEDLESLTAPSADEAEVAEGREFVCWKFVYDNNAIALLEPGEEFVPFMGGEFVALTCEVEEPEEVISHEVVVSLGGGLFKDPGADTDRYDIYFTLDDDSMEYSGANAAPSKYTINKVEKNSTEVSAIELADYSMTGVNLSLKKGDKVGEYKDIGTYAIVIPNTNTIAVSNETDDISARAYLHFTEGEFEITKRTLSVKADAVSKEYDGKVLAGAATGDKLLEGHKITAGVKYSLETAAICNTTYTADASTKVADVVIKEGSKDVTSLYDITIDSSTTATYVITAPETKTKISAEPQTVTKNYTGSLVEGSVVTDGTLPKGATLEPVFDYNGADHTSINSAGIPYTLKSLVIKLDGYDISAAFDIDIKDTEATLYIKGHPLTITVKPKTKEYDGSPLVSELASGCTVSGLMEDHSLYSITYTGSQTDVGSSKSTVNSFEIRDASSNDVTGFYDVTVVDGTLTVTPLKFTLAPKDVSKKFDGTALDAPNEYKTLSHDDKAKLDKLGSWTINMTASGSRTDVGTSESTISSVELKVGSTVVNTKNYEVTREKGVIEITEDPSKETVTITVESKSKTYDGKALLLEPTAYRIDSDKLPSGYSIKVTLETASITGAGTKTVGVKEYKVYNGDTLIEDPANYPVNIKIVEGKLEVKKYPVTITAKSGTKYYDGKEFVLNAVTITAAGNKLVDGQKPDITVEAQDDAGNPVKAIKVGKYYNVVTQVVIKEGNKDVTDNYDITTVNGTLTIKNSNGNPQTGDTSNISLWATVLAVSAVAVVCIAVIFIVRNKKKAD